MTVTLPEARSADVRDPDDALSARVLDGLAAIPSQEWDALIQPSSGTLSHGYLAAWEKSELAGLCSRPVVAHSVASGAPIAACPGYFYLLDLVGVRFPAATGVMRALRRMREQLLYARTYELGSPTPLTNPFLVAEPGLRGPAVREMIATALEIGEREGAQFLLVQNFTSLDGPAADELAHLGFAAVPMLPTAVVPLPYDSFDDYLGAMRAQYRRRARQALKRAKDLRIEHHRRFAELAGELARLWRLIYERATELKREILTPAYFRAISELEGSSVLLARRGDGSIASFALLLDDHPWLSFLQCGFDAEAARSEGAYFRLLYEIMRLGIQGGFEQVELGITTLEPKLDVGGVPVPLFAWVKHRNPIIQSILRALANGPMRPSAMEPRHVFKEPPPNAAELVSRRGLPA